jgi:hypothetical protein
MQPVFLKRYYKFTESECCTVTWTTSSVTSHLLPCKFFRQNWQEFKLNMVIVQIICLDVQCKSQTNALFLDISHYSASHKCMRRPIMNKLQTCDVIVQNYTQFWLLLLRDVQNLSQDRRSSGNEENTRIRGHKAANLTFLYLISFAAEIFIFVSIHLDQFQRQLTVFWGLFKQEYWTYRHFKRQWLPNLVNCLQGSGPPYW